ncbi:Uncharacterised protein [Mycobacterium tuberculosis]|nr:Uncharacterised protein [Mycobacterium tuberculosis]
MHLGPFNLLCLGAEVAQKRNPVAAPGQHDQRLPSVDFVGVQPAQVFG